MEKVKTILVDDEAHCMSALKYLLEENCPQIEIIGTANNALDAIKLIAKLNPELIFLDIDMPNGNGFDVLEGIPERNFDVIFVTAYDHYAIKAFKFSAIDYILKPIDVKELIDAVNKVYDNRLRLSSKINKYDALFDNLQTNLGGHIAITTSDKIEFINPLDIVRIEADKSYSTIFLADKTSLFVSKSISEFQNLLDENLFYRTHKSHLVNVKMVKRFHNRDGGYIELVTKDNIPLSRRNKSEFLEKMNLSSIKGFNWPFFKN